MNANQAVELLDAAASQFRGTRQDHQNLLDALKTIREIVFASEPPPALKNTSQD